MSKNLPTKDEKLFNVSISQIEGKNQICSGYMWGTSKEDVMKKAVEQHRYDKTIAENVNERRPFYCSVSDACKGENDKLCYDVANREEWRLDFKPAVKIEKCGD